MVGAVFIEPLMSDLMLFVCRFISYCVKENAYTGFDFKDAEGEEDIVSRLATLNLNVEAES